VRATCTWPQSSPRWRAGESAECNGVSRARLSSPPLAVTFYVTTTASTLKLKADISRITQILQAHGVEYEEV